MAWHKPQIDGHETRADKTAMKFLKMERTLRSMRDALRRMITDWEVSRDLEGAVEHAKAVLAEAQEELK